MSVIGTLIISVRILLARVSNLERTPLAQGNVPVYLTLLIKNKRKTLFKYGIIN